MRCSVNINILVPELKLKQHSKNAVCQETCHVTLKGPWRNSVRKLNKQGGNIGGKGKHKKEEERHFKSKDIKKPNS